MSIKGSENPFRDDDDDDDDDDGGGGGGGGGGYEDIYFDCDYPP